MSNQDSKRLQLLRLLAENPELLSDLDFKDILSLSPER